MLFSILLAIAILGVKSDNPVSEGNTQDGNNLMAENEGPAKSYENNTYDTINIVSIKNVNGIAKTLVSLLKTDENDTRINELNDKLNKIDDYVVDKDKIAELLKNITTESSLNATMFYKSLKEDDHLNFLSDKESKNLYLKLKENMNRDDILRIISERGNGKKIVKYARRMMQEDLAYSNKNNKDIINAVVDKILGEKPHDEHKYEHLQNESIYWDPKRELQELQEYHAQKVDGRRLFRGVRTTVRYFPFMVSVHVAGRFWCGGVIYWHDLVLTSASCLQLLHNNRFYRENPRVLSVRVGSNHSRIGGEEIEANEVYFHPGYNPRTLRNNIAAIRLRRHLYFSYHRIPKIIEISNYPHGIASTSEVLLLGWGVTKMSQKISYEPIYLQRKVLPVYPNSFCKEVYGDKFITSTMFCAGTMTTGEGACDHDAGGPAILGGKLVGIISFGPAVCGFPNAPTVFTLVGAYADWIQSVNDSMPPYYRGKKFTTTTQRPRQITYLQTLLFHYTSTPETTTTTTTEAPMTTTAPERILRTVRNPFAGGGQSPKRIVPPVYNLMNMKDRIGREKNRMAKKKPFRQEPLLSKGVKFDIDIDSD